MSTQKPSSKETVVNYQRYVGPAMLGVAAVAVLAALGVPVIAFFPFLIFLACPLMMVFMMRGMDHGGGSGHAGCHGGHGSHQQADKPSDTSATQAPSSRPRPARGAGQGDDTDWNRRCTGTVPCGSPVGGDCCDRDQAPQS